MNKPKLFLLTIFALMSGVLFLTSGLVLGALNSWGILYLSLISLGILLLAGSYLIFIVRQEKQNQRVNSQHLRELAKLDSFGPQLGGGAANNFIDSVSRAVQQNNEQVLRSNLEVLHAIRELGMEGPKRSLNSLPSQLEGSVSMLPRSSKPKSLRSEENFGINKTAQPPLPKVLSRSDNQIITEMILCPNSSVPPFSYIPLNSEPLICDLQLNQASRVDLLITLASASSTPNAKAALVSVDVVDVNGKLIDFELLPSFSDKFGYFSYLKHDGGTETVNRIGVSIPRVATRLRIKLYRWSGNPELKNKIQVQTIEQNPIWGRNRRANEIKVASILDEFSHNCFKFECNLISLDPNNWKTQLSNFQPDLFICESAWSGADSNLRPWKGKIYASENFQKDYRTELKEILSFCRQHGIPTVFWNKEDPSHYDDKKHNFVDTAILFDHIFTTDIHSVGRYQQEHGHKSVDVLPFAVQPRLFNPINVGQRSQDVVFAGGWYSNHRERCNSMMEIFKAVEESPYNLKIYDRFYASDDDSHRFPREFQGVLNPPIPNEEMAGVYKESDFGITINTEINSPTMFARRIFELMACNTIVISNESRGVRNFFGDDVIFLDREPDALVKKNREELDDIRSRNLQKVLSEHTYEHRFKTILQRAGVEFADRGHLVSKIVKVDSMQEAASAFRLLSKISPNRGSRVLLLSEMMSNLDYADALTQWNTDGIRVVYTKQILNGLTTAEEVFGLASNGIILRPEDLENEQELNRTLKQFQLHAQYMEIPMIEASEEEAGRQNFVFGTANAPRQLFIKSESFVSALRKLSEGLALTVYKI